MKKILKIVLISCLLSLTMTVNILADALTPLYINFGKEGTDEPYIKSMSFDGDEVNGYLIQDEGYELTSNEKGKFIIVDGVDVVGTNYPASDCWIMNGGTYINGNYVFTSTYEHARLIDNEGLQDLLDTNCGDYGTSTYSTNGNVEIIGFEEIWADVVEINKNDTLTMTGSDEFDEESNPFRAFPSIHVFKNLKVDGNIIAEEFTRIELFKGATFSGIDFYDADDLQTPIDDKNPIDHNMMFEYRNVGDEQEPVYKWVLCKSDYDAFGFDPETEAMIEVCITGNAPATSSISVNPTMDEIPNIEKEEGLYHKFVVSQGSTVTIAINLGLKNSHIENWRCEQDEAKENVAYSENTFTFDVEDLIEEGKEFIFFEVEALIDCNVKFNSEHGNVKKVIHDPDKDIDIFDENDITINEAFDTNENMIEFVVFPEDGYEVSSVKINSEEIEYGIVNIGGFNYARYTAELGDPVIEIDIEYVVSNISVTFNSDHGNVKQLYGNDTFSENLELNTELKLDNTERIEFAVFPSNGYSTTSVKVNNQQLQKYTRHIGDTDYECYSFDVDGTEFVIDITYASEEDLVKQDLNNYMLAFYGEKSDLVNYASIYLSDEFIKNWHGDNGKYADFFKGLGIEDVAALAGKIKLSDNTSTEGSITYDGSPLPYYTYTIDGLTGFKGRIYVLSSNSEYILRDGNTYKKIAVPEEASMLNTTLHAYVSDLNDYSIFGNGAMDQGQSLLYDGQSRDYVDVRQVSPLGACGNAFNIASKLILYKQDFRGVYVASVKSAPPWSFANYPLYGLNENAEANIFYGNEAVTISKPLGSSDLCNIKDINFENGTKTLNGSTIEKNNDEYTVTFGSIYYDEIKVIVTFNDDTAKELLIRRVGIKILDSYKDNNNKYVVWHGTDHTSEYEPTVDGSNYIITASFYYPEVKREEIKRVSLFVKITNANGTTESKVIRKPMNENVISKKENEIDTPEDPNSYFDDYLIWEGKEEDRPYKVEVIAYLEGDADTFGGVKLGSGAGVSWIR